MDLSHEESVLLFLSDMNTQMTMSVARLQVCKVQGLTHEHTARGAVEPLCNLSEGDPGQRRAERGVKDLEGAAVEVGPQPPAASSRAPLALRWGDRRPPEQVGCTPGKHAVSVVYSYTILEPRNGRSAS